MPRGGNNNPTGKGSTFKKGVAANPEGKGRKGAKEGVLVRYSRFSEAQRLSYALEFGITPLQFLGSIVRDESQPTDLRIEAAKAAAPYVHRKLAPILEDIASGGQITKRGVLLLPADASEDEWKRMAAEHQSKIITSESKDVT